MALEYRINTGVKDMFKRDIYTGDIVVYPVRRGKDTFLNYLRVNGALEGVLTGVNNNRRFVRIRCVERCAIVGVE